MSKTMLRIFAIIMIVLIVALSGCTGGDKEPAEVESTPETPPAATDTPATPVATPETPAATPVATPDEAKVADAEELFTPKESDLPPSGSISGCAELDQSILRMYDDDGDGKIDDNWMVNAAIDLDHSLITQSGYDQVKYAYERGCSVE